MSEDFLTLKNEVFNNVKFIDTISKISNSTELSPKMTYMFYRLGKELMERSQEYEAVRTKLLEKYADENKENPGMYDVGKENYPAFKQDFDELLSLDFEISFQQLTPEVSLKLIKILKLSANEMVAVEELFDYSKLDELEETEE